jgi:phosphoglycerate dehydrogenase-like enzyme
MQIIVLSPNWKIYFTKEQIEKLKSQSEVIFIDQIKPLAEIAELRTKIDKIVAIDPDFCNWSVSKTDIEVMVNVKAIVLQSTSFSWIDHKTAAARSIPVVNLRNWCTFAVAEWATMLMLLLARKVPVFIRDGYQQDFSKHQGIELRGKTVGVIGLGNIGKAFAENAQGLGMNVQYWSKHSSDKRFKKVELEELIKTSDVVFPAVAQNDDTSGLLTDNLLKTLKKTAIFVSIVHRIYNHELLVEMVNKGILFGYGFESGTPVFDKYHGNIWAGPELAWCTIDSFKRNANVWIEQILKAFEGNYPNKVN